MATKKIFVSFDYENDKHYKNMLLAWSANSDFADFYINDQSVSVPVDSESAAPIRRVISAKINASTGLLCIVGKETSKSRWVTWEVEKAVELRKRIIAVKVSKDSSTPACVYGVGATWALSFNFDAIKAAIEAAYK